MVRFPICFHRGYRLIGCLLTECAAERTARSRLGFYTVVNTWYIVYHDFSRIQFLGWVRRR
jgi:hypothetical protein